MKPRAWPTRSLKSDAPRLKLAVGWLAPGSAGICLPGAALEEEGRDACAPGYSMKPEPQNVESIDGHPSRRVRLVKAEDIAAEVSHQLGSSSILAIYRDKIRPNRSRQYDLRAPAKRTTVEILHTLLGIELKVGNRRLLCPDLATARYLSVFARLGCNLIAVPYDITQISWIADELESSWHRMMLLVDHLSDGRSERLRALVRKRLIAEARAAIDSLGAGSRFPEFNQAKRQSPRR